MNVIDLISVVIPKLIVSTLSGLISALVVVDILETELFAKVNGQTIH